MVRNLSKELAILRKKEAQRLKKLEQERRIALQKKQIRELKYRKYISAGRSLRSGLRGAGANIRTGFGQLRKDAIAGAKLLREREARLKKAQQKRRKPKKRRRGQQVVYVYRTKPKRRRRKQRKVVYVYR